MNVIGIIAEYNPFHNGHAYQIAHVRKNLHADYIVVATSGDYVQRGEPALLDKYTRARMALSSGADVVLELPVLWSTASAELFADAGISLFEKTGCVNGICFGAESGDLALLRRIADVLADEPAAHLDLTNAQELMNLLGSFSLGTVSVIVASHLQLLPANVSHKTIYLGDGPVTYEDDEDEEGASCGY